ncbi:MAG: response regulator, partial [Bacillota bacterium]|nr:response regulator [Bacillota bacterium]
LDRIRRPQDLVFKRNGPAYVVCLTDGGRQTALDTLAKVKEGVRAADAFIETLSVSAAVVRVAEIPKDAVAAKLADAMFAIGDARIRFALENGPSALVDETTKIATIRAGRILLVDDDPSALALLAALLRADNYDVVTAADGLTALSHGTSKPFDVVVCERNVPKLDGFGLRHELYAGSGTAPRLFILMTYAKTRETVVRANQAEIDYVLEKPIIYEELGGLIRRAVRKAGLSR